MAPSNGCYGSWGGGNGRDWCQWLLYLLFAITEVPQSSTGFSPFELLYGQQPRRLLDVLREEWEDPAVVEDTLASYLEALCQIMRATVQLALAELEKAQGEQQQCYNAQVKPHAFTVRQQVAYLFNN